MVWRKPSERKMLPYNNVNSHSIFCLLSPDSQDGIALKKKKKGVNTVPALPQRKETDLSGWEFVPLPSLTHMYSTWNTSTHTGIAAAFKIQWNTEHHWEKKTFGKKSKSCYLLRTFLPEMLDFNSQIITLPSLTMRAAAFSFTGQHTMLKGRTVLVTLMASHWLLKS